MGRFSSAFNAGEAEKQSAMDAEKKKREAESEARSRQTAGAERWFDEVLAPVVLEARTDLQSSGLELQFIKVPGDPVQGAISISAYGKVTSASVHVHSRGVVNSFDQRGQPSDLRGDLNSTPREHVARWLENLVKEMGKA